MHKNNLKRAITNIYNHLYANSEKKTPQGISEEVAKILNIGIYLEKYTLNKPAFLFSKVEEKLLLEKKYIQYAKLIVTHFEEMKDKLHLYDINEKINLKEFDICYTCIQLNGIELSNQNIDILGDSIEIFRSQWAKQIGGQFFTDPLITRLSMTLLDFNPENGDDLVDICSGTGGFLLAGLNHIQNIVKNSKGSLNLHEIATKSIKGQEYDTEVRNIANTTLRSRTNIREFNFVDLGDSLDIENFSNEKSKIKFNSHYCIAGNPPFGTKITIKDSRILENYELARVKARKDDSLKSKIVHRAPDILFIEQNLKLLIPGKGRMSLVVPYQILSGPQAKYIREWLLQNTIINSVIDLPADTFQPHTGTKGCLLTVTRRLKPLKDLNEIEDHNIFMSTPKWIGHDRRGNPIYKKNIDGTVKDEILTDFKELEEAYISYTKKENFSKIHDQSFQINIFKVLENDFLQLNSQYYKPTEYREIKANNKLWNIVKIKDVALKIYYPGRFTRGYIEYNPTAIPFFGGKEITQMVTESNKWLSPNHAKLKELEVKKGMILITRSGTTGIVSIVPESWDGFAMSEHVIRVVPNEAKINPYYLLSFLKTKFCQDLISKGVYGSVIDSITPEFIGNIEIRVPKDQNILNRIINNSMNSEIKRNEALTLGAQSINELNNLLIS